MSTNTLKKNLQYDMDMESITATSSTITLETASMSDTESECCICFEMIQKTNNCTTPCGHIFCFQCIVKSLDNNNTCPCCRSIIGNAKDEEDFEDDEDEDEDEDEEDDEENEDFLESLSQRFESKGYTLKDALCMLGGIYSNKNKKYNNDYFKKMSDEFDAFLEENVNEERECKMFAMEDKRTIVDTMENTDESNYLRLLFV